jgi:hypothetical protein
MVFACLGIAACLLWNCCLVAFHCLFPLCFFPFRFSIFILRSVVGTWGAPSVFLLFRPCLRAFGPSLLVLCFLAGVPLFHRRPSAFVGFRRRHSCRLSSVFVGFRRLRRCYSARLCFLAGVPCFLAGVLLFLSASVGFPRCYSARHFGVIRLGISVFSGRGSAFTPGVRCLYSAFVVLSSKPAFFLSAFCRRLSEFRRCFGDSFRRLFFPPVFIPVSVGVYIGVLVPRILLAGILLFRWFCASRPVFRCSVCVLPPVFFRRLSSAFVVILAGFRRCFSARHFGVSYRGLFLGSSRPAGFPSAFRPVGVMPPMFRLRFGDSFSAFFFRRCFCRCFIVLCSVFLAVAVRSCVVLAKE